MWIIKVKTGRWRSYKSKTMNQTNYSWLWRVDSHDVLHRLGFDEDGDGMKLSQLQSLDGVSRHVQDTVFTLRTAEEEELWIRGRSSCVPNKVAAECISEIMSAVVKWIKIIKHTLTVKLVIINMQAWLFSANKSVEEQTARTFSATSRTDCTLVPYRWLLYCPASMNLWSWMSFSICSLDTTKW